MNIYKQPIHTYKRPINTYKQPINNPLTPLFLLCIPAAYPNYPISPTYPTSLPHRTETCTPTSTVAVFSSTRS